MKKVQNRRRLRQILRGLQRRGKKVVFTNGCFDLFHAGHLKVLQKAKSLGDILVVALNSDGSVRRLKGAGRPLVSERWRSEVLAGLACVDFVTVFDEDTPQEIIEELRPDVLVKGGDYALAHIVGRQSVQRVVRVPLLKGHSTTSLIKRIVKHYG